MVGVARFFWHVLCLLAMTVGAVLFVALMVLLLWSAVLAHV